MNRWNTYYGKSLLELFKMEEIKPIRFSEIKHFCTGDYAKENMDDLIEEKLYLERKGKLKQLKIYEDFQELQDHDKLYYQSISNWNLKLYENLTIKSIDPSGFFPGQIVKKLKDTLSKKEVKFKSYKKFDENNLYIQTFSANAEEYREFEESTDFSNCCFDYIYISNFWSKDEPIYIINTRE